MFSKRNILECAQAKLGCVYKRDKRREKGKRINLIQTKVDKYMTGCLDSKAK